MAINTSLFVAAPILQDTFVDTSGQPMAAGTITCYMDTSRTTLKNWYYQTGTPGAYEYIALPNPLTLSAAGTICDESGVDTIPFFYPYNEDDSTEEEPYYIVIKNYSETNQITRENFPFSGTGVRNSGLSQDNYIVNNVFWRNTGVVTLTSVLDMVMAPSQHDGFRMPDIRFIKNKTGATEIGSFLKFPLSNTPALVDDPTPEYYLNHSCTAATTGETQKVYQFPISYHVNTLAGQQCTITVQGQNIGGSTSAESTIYFYILQDLGSGVTEADPILIGSVTFGPSWEKFEIPYTFPGTESLTLSAAGDDALYLQIGMPLNSICDINFTKPSLYLLENDSPTNSFQTYDQIDPIINGPRTGDVRISLNSFSPYGWVAANDGTIGSEDSSATTRANVDTWPLYNLIWGSVSDSYAPVSGGRGSSAYNDFVANKAMALTKALGRVLGGAGSAGSGLTARSLGEPLGTETATLAVENIPAHTHVIGGSVKAQLISSGTEVVSTGGSSVSSESTGSGTEFSIMQPSVFYNVFFKL